MKTTAPAEKNPSPVTDAAAPPKPLASHMAVKSVPAPVNATAAVPLLISPVVRAILIGNLDRPVDDVIREAQAQGVTAPTDKIRRLVTNIRSELKIAARKGKAAAKSAPAARPVLAAAMKTAVPSPVKTAPTPAVTPSTTADLAEVLGNVALVNKVIGVAGGAEQVRQVAEAVKACRGVDAFLQHVDLVAGIRGGKAR